MREQTGQFGDRVSQQRPADIRLHARLRVPAQAVCDCPERHRTVGRVFVPKPGCVVQYGQPTQTFGNRCVSTGITLWRNEADRGVTDSSPRVDVAILVGTRILAQLGQPALGRRSLVGHHRAHDLHDYAAMFVSALTQYNSSSHSVSINARFRWEYRPGSDLFVVYSDGRDTAPSMAFYPSSIARSWSRSTNFCDFERAVLGWRCGMRTPLRS